MQAHINLLSPSQSSHPNLPTALSINSSSSFENKENSTDDKVEQSKNIKIPHNIIKEIEDALIQLKKKGVEETDQRYVTLLKLLESQGHKFCADGTPKILEAKNDSKEQFVGPLTDAQLQQLRAQMVAFKYLSRNLALHKDLAEGIQRNDEPKLRFEKLLNQSANVEDFSEEYLKAIDSRIQRRIAELKMLPANLPPHQKKRALIELKMLELRKVQKKVRLDLTEEYRKTCTLEAPFNRMLYRRPKKFVLREASLLERQQRVDSSARKELRHQEFLKEVLQHAVAFRNYHREAQRVNGRVWRAVGQYHANKEKLEAAQRDREQKERLRLLKANDEAGYMKLLEDSKNERLLSLLHQTDDYLNSLGEKVKQMQEMQRQALAAEFTPLPSSPQQPAPRFEDDDLVVADLAKKAAEETGESGAAPTKSTSYYEATHAIQESISKQPDMLVGGTLKSYQLAGLTWMVSLYNNGLNGILADEMGLGKTIQTIALLTYLMESKMNNGPFLVIVPLSTLANWRTEFQKWAPAIKVVIYRGPPQTRKDIYRSEIADLKFNVLLTTYEFVIKDKGLLSRPRWKYIIIDEGHRIKNHNSKLSLTLATHYHSNNRILLTGTPLQNSLPELWSLLNFLLPTIFSSVDTFEQWFNQPFQTSGDRVELNEEETILIINRLHKLLRPFLLRRLKREVEKELPDKTERVIRCELSSLQKRLYHSIQETGRTLDVTGQNKGRSVENIMMQLRKVCNHPFLFPEMDRPTDPISYLYRTSGKFELLDRILPKLKRGGHRVLLFSQMTQLLTILEDFFIYRGYKYLRLDGSTNSDKRGDLLKVFNDPESEVFIFILSTRAGGLGLNLQTADTVIIFDSDWNPHMDLQAQDRAHRIGQKEEVKVFRLITATKVEEAILARAGSKLDMDSKIIQAGKFNAHSTADERRSLLQQLIRKDEEEEDNDITDPDQVNQMLARNDEEYELFTRIDEEIAARDSTEWSATGGQGSPPSRLMRDEELPVWMEELEKEAEENRKKKVLEKPLLFGRGHRQRDAVVYNDHLTEREFIQLAEGRMNMEEILLKHKAKKETPRTRTRLNREEGPSRSELRRLKKLLIDALTTITDHVVADEEGGGEERRVADIFSDLPSRTDYPDYYDFIDKPMSLALIRKRINADGYHSIREFEADLHLVFSNAQEFNEPGSLIHSDAALLQALTVTLVEQLKERLEGLSSDEESESETSSKWSHRAKNPAPPGPRRRPGRPRKRPREEVGEGGEGLEVGE